MQPKVLDSNSCEFYKLQKVAEIIEKKCNNTIKCVIEEVYFDYGQNWIWTTIVATRKTDGSHWQMLYPPIWEEILMANHDSELEQIADSIIANQTKLIFM